jgi:xanthine dehydrogenase accessory factor
MLDLEALSNAVEQHKRVARVVVAEVKGSAPREAGAAMLIWADGREGTIGGGRLELDAERHARRMLMDDAPEAPVTALKRQALGPALNQCCGGAVSVVTEIYDATRFREMTGSFDHQGIWARPVTSTAGALAKSAARQISQMESSDTPIPTTLTGGWLIEAVWRDRQAVYIYGAGHVGRALALVLAPMPQFDVFLVDLRQDQFAGIPNTVNQSWQAPPTEVMTSADAGAAHFIMTPEHDFDLELCHTLLKQEFAFAGLIGSETKWARFRSRLKMLGHSENRIAQITCPIGNPELGRHPQAISISVAAELLKTKNRVVRRKEQIA